MTQPQADSNRTRWPTDPVWAIIQRAQFSDQVPAPLQRHKHVTHDLELIDAELYGLFKLQSVLCERQLDETLTLSLELRAFSERMAAVDLERDRDCYEAVREKARVLGRAAPMRSKALDPDGV